MVFKKNKMLKRLNDAGLGARVDKISLSIMDNLDGCEATASCWRRVVLGEPVLWVVGKNGQGEYVNEADCE